MRKILDVITLRLRIALGGSSQCQTFQSSQVASLAKQTSDDYVEAPDWSVDGLDEQFESEAEPELEAAPSTSPDAVAS